MITYDLECDLDNHNCIICSYDATGADFQNSLYDFSQSEKILRVQCIVIVVITYTEDALVIAVMPVLVSCIHKLS